MVFNWRKVTFLLGTDWIKLVLFNWKIQKKQLIETKERSLTDSV